jgi:antitoxin VapB
VNEKPPKPKVSYRDAAKRSRVFRSGGSLAVRLPKEFNLEETDVTVSRVNDCIMIKPISNSNNVDAWWNSWTAMPDFMADGRNQPAMQQRDLTW